MIVVVGGTFAYLHKGHKELLTKAFKSGDYVFIGLTSDEYVMKKKKASIESYTERKRNLANFIEKFGKPFKIVKLSDAYGQSVTGNFDAIVVSTETAKIAVQINRIRKKHNLKPLRVIKVNIVKAYDGKLISSSRIQAGEIDINGKKKR